MSLMGETKDAGMGENVNSAPKARAASLAPCPHTHTHTSPVHISNSTVLRHPQSPRPTSVLRNPNNILVFNLTGNE